MAIMNFAEYLNERAVQGDVFHEPGMKHAMSPITQAQDELYFSIKHEMEAEGKEPSEHEVTAEFDKRWPAYLKKAKNTKKYKSAEKAYDDVYGYENQERIDRYNDGLKKRNKVDEKHIE